ncbi:MAG: winged helix-turn-helix domain-containing protein [Acidobacteriota bacterium]|nr:winged helix-turn-helix domain-containing protein [Acidobacteriota bacterium]
MKPSDLQDGAPASSGRLWHFAGREFDEARLELRVEGKLVDLELKPLEILLQLLLHAGEVVNKEQLLDAVWPGLAVVEGSLTTAVYKLRKAIGDHDSTIIVTVPRVGYRLTVSVRSQASQVPAFHAEVALETGEPVPGREHWRLSRQLEVSPNSEVWLAEHPRSHELRVFKFASNAARFKALRREVTVFRFLRECLGERPEFVRIFEWNFDAPPYFLESEFGGPNLAEWAESLSGLGNIPVEQRVAIVAKIAEAVATAHGAGVVHKDLKPGNVLVARAGNGEEQIKIVDFGSASLIEPSRLKALGITSVGLTQTTRGQTPSLTGTLLYLAPEVICGQPATAASDVYALGVILYQAVIGDFRKPLSPGWEAGIADPVIRDDIAQAVCGDPAKRLKSAAELAERLLTLDRRRLEQKQLEEIRNREQDLERKRAEARARRPWVALAVLAILALTATLYFRRNPPRPRPLAAGPPVRSVAVLPFQNAGGDQSVDFLSLALPDEVATTLSYSRGIAMRPFTATRKFTGSDIDPQKAGRELGVRSVVTGHFLEGEKQLEVTLEAVDVKSNRLLWRDTLDAPAGDLTDLQRQLTDTTRAGLSLALGSSASAEDTAAHPRDAEAYALYLQSIPLANDGAPNQKGTAMLEKAVALDPKYAPAWYALGLRYYLTYQYGGGGEAMLGRSDAAYERALALEPNYIAPGTYLVISRVERGQLSNAYQEASALVRGRPESADAHFVLGYVLRYAGLMQEAAKQCNTAWTLDPHNPLWRSCENIFEELGDFQRAMDFLHLANPNTRWAKTHLMQLLVREGKTKEAVAVPTAKIPGWESFTMLQDCAGHRPQNEIAALAKAVRPDPDPEMNYSFAAHLAYCGQTDDAFRLLTLSIQGNHCSYPEMDTDPLMEKLRTKRQFAEVRAAGIACQKAFLAARQSIEVARR